jgi:restriction endonuclease Mrr
LKSNLSKSSLISENSSTSSPRQVNVSENILKPKYPKKRGATSRKKYIFPILEYLVLNNGSITNDVAYHHIESKFQEDFNPIDNGLLGDGKTKRWEENVGWALTYMKKSGMLIQDKRGEWKITKDGEEFYKKLKENPLSQIKTSEFDISLEKP